MDLKDSIYSKKDGISSFQIISEVIKFKQENRLPTEKKKMSDQIQNILHQGKNENATEFDRQQMLALFHKSEIEYLLKEQLLEELEISNENETVSRELLKVFNRLWMKIEKTKTKQKPGIRFLYSISKIAAILVIGFFIGLYISSIRKSQVETEYYVAHSPKGSVSDIILPDGTVIFLNADSYIKYSMDGNKGVREAFLQGEAWFDVSKSKKQSFIVHTSTYDVNVTGTQFNIKAYNSEQEVTTTLEEGSVIISSSVNSKMSEDIILKPGEQLVLNKGTREAVVKNVNTKWFTSWKDNKLIFINMELNDLVVLLERKFGVEIDVRNKDLLELHFDGTIKNESIMEILEILKKTLPIDYKISGQKIEITNN